MTTKDKDGLERLYTIKELTAKGLGCRSTIYYYVKKGELTPIKLSKIVLFAESDVKAFIRRKTRRDKVKKQKTEKRKAEALASKGKK